MLFTNSNKGDQRREESSVSKHHLINENSIIEASKKDPACFKTIYENYHHSIFNYIFEKTNDLEVSADITSVVFIKALTNLKKYKPRSGIPFSAWLYKIAFNETMMYFRHKKRHRLVVLDEPVLKALANEVETDNMPELWEILEQTIQNLGTKEIELIDLRYYQKKSFREIAFILGISENNAKVKMHRLMTKMRKLMDEKIDK